MSTLLMLHSTQKGLEVSQCFGPIQSLPEKAVLWSVKTQSEKLVQSHSGLHSQNVMIFYSDLNK